MGTNDGRINAYNLSLVLRKATDPDKLCARDFVRDPSRSLATQSLFVCGKRGAFFFLDLTQEQALCTRRSRGAGKTMWDAAVSRGGTYLAGGSAQNLVYLWRRQSSSTEDGQGEVAS